MISEADAIRTYPELAQLVAIRDAGWRFLSIVADGQLDGLVGARHWPGHTDALWIYDRTDTLAVRLLADAPGARGGLIWRRSGALSDTAAALLELPAPDEEGAPSLMLARPWIERPPPIPTLTTLRIPAEQPPIPADPRRETRRAGGVRCSLRSDRAAAP
ncbi:MAG: hypothetical protein M3R63_15140 [Actinomycetota bacterium]|nr:hypothetical protein [Actinomycetota bacterium]